jgi:hypothetical protein
MSLQTVPNDSLHRQALLRDSIASLSHRNNYILAFTNVAVFDQLINAAAPATVFLEIASRFRSLPVHDHDDQLAAR